MRKIFCVFGALAFSACAAPASAPPPAPTLPATIAPTATLIPTSTTEPTAVPVFTPTTIATISAIQQPTSTRAAIIAIDSSWSVFRPEVVDLEIKGKTLTLVLNRTALWFNNQHGALVYKLVTGNFKATAIVNARKRTNPAQAPSIAVHLGGLMARNPVGVGTGGAENYVFIVVGFDVDDLSVETKTTFNNNSQYEGPTWGTSDAELRMCRVGAAFYLFKRRIGAATWTLAQTYQRADLPPTLQVGANIYSLNEPDLRVMYENLRIEDVADRVGCERD